MTKSNTIVVKCEKECPVKKGFVVRQERRDEIKLFFRLEGCKKKHTEATILFVHGLGSDHRMWRCQQKEFCTCFQTLAIDLRGFGKSSKPADSPYSYEMFSEDIKAILDDLHIESVIYVGAGVGASLGIFFTEKYGCLVEELVISGANPLYAVDDREKWAFALFTFTELDRICNLIQTDYFEFAKLLAERFAFTDNCKGIQKLQNYSINVTLDTPQDTYLQILGCGNEQSFVYEELFNQIKKLNDNCIAILILIGSASPDQDRGSAGYLFSNLLKVNALIYEFPCRGNYANASEVNNYNLVLFNFLCGNKSKKCDLCKKIAHDHCRHWAPRPVTRTLQLGGEKKEGDCGCGGAK